MPLKSIDYSICSVLNLMFVAVIYATIGIIYNISFDASAVIFWAFICILITFAGIHMWKFIGFLEWVIIALVSFVFAILPFLPSNIGGFSADFRYWFDIFIFFYTIQLSYMICSHKRCERIVKE